MTHTDNSSKYWIFVNGPCGAGKTTALSALGNRYSYNVLKVGPYFRATTESHDYGPLKTAMTNRVPIPNKYIEQYIHEHATLKGKIFLVDGLPRSKENIVLIDKLSQMYFIPVFVSINISFAASVERVLRRRTCVECGNVGDMPVCLHCGRLTVLRNDDAKMDMDVLNRRYHSMQSVIHTLSQKHNVHVIDGSKSTEQIANDLYVIIQRTTF